MARAASRTVRSSCESFAESISVISAPTTDRDAPARKANWRNSSALIPPGAAAGQAGTTERYLSPELEAATTFVASGRVMSAIQ